MIDFLQILYLVHSVYACTSLMAKGIKTFNPVSGGGEELSHKFWFVSPQEVLLDKFSFISMNW